MTNRTAVTAAFAALALAGCQKSPADNKAANAAPAKAPAPSAATPAGKTRDGPFGIPIGEPIANLPGAMEVRPGWYTISAPAKPNPDFPSVLVEAFPDTGVCFIKGVGQAFDGDWSGAKLMSQVDATADALATKYGQPRKTDTCDHDSSSCNPGYWTMHISTGARRYSCTWELNPAINGISSVFVVAQASDALFYGANGAACKAAENKLNASSL